MRPIPIPIALLTLAVAAAPEPSARADEDARALVQSFLDRGAELFDARDAAGLAATYLEDAELTVIAREDGSGGLKTETRQGRAAIEQIYRDLFKDNPALRSRNTVEYARRIGPDLVVVQGVFRVNPDAEAWPFVQVRRKQGDAWRILRLQLFLIPAE